MEHLNETNPVVIDLSQSTNAKSFDNSNFLHALELMQAKSFINDRSKLIDDIKEKNVRDNIRLNDTITILGTRGSGKTSFLYKIYDEYRSSEDIEVLDVIDPTLIEEKGHIFLTIISEIVKRVDSELREKELNPNPCYSMKKEWKQSVIKLARGIPSIGGINDRQDTWNDPEYIMENTLRGVASAKDLEKDFGSMLKLALDILGKKFFILLLDDIDIDFKKGWPVLESIRKYLSSPYILTFMSGDLKLFSKAIRKQQWANFGKALLVNEGEKLGRLAEFNDAVTEMESQYMQKVMQPSRRLHLSTIKEKLELFNSIRRTDSRIKSKCNIEISSSYGYNRPITEYYDHILENIGINSPSQSKLFQSFLLSLPLRTQIHFMNKLSDTRNPENGVLDVFLNDVYEKGIDGSLLKNSDQFINILALKLMLDENILDDSYQMLPISSDSSLNAVLTTLTTFFARKVASKPYLIFDYMLRIGYIRNLITLFPVDSQDRAIYKFSIKKLCKYSHLFQTENLKNNSGRVISYIRGYFMQDKKIAENRWGGIITLPGLAATAKKKEDKVSDRVDIIIEKSDLDTMNRCIAYMPLTISMPSTRQQSILNYSVFTLFSCIGEILRSHTENETKESLLSTILHLSQIRSYPIPDVFTHRDEISSHEEYLSVDKNQLIDSIKLQNLQTWINSYEVSKIPPYLLGKISTRIFYALRNLERNDSADNLGDAMMSRIIIILNSVLVEEARERYPSLILNNNNPADNTKIFIDNIQKIIGEKVSSVPDDKNETVVSSSYLPLSQWILSCPIFISFIDTGNTDLCNLLYAFCNESYLCCKSYNVYSTLRNVKLPVLSNRKTKNLPVFSAGKEGHKYDNTLNILKKVFSNSEDFISTPHDEIIELLEDKFQSINSRSLNVFITQCKNGLLKW